MKYVEIHIPYNSRNDIFHLYPFGDLHLGHVNTHIELIKRTVAVIEKDRFARVICMGDYGNVDIPGDKFFDFNSLDLAHYPTPDLQYAGVMEQFTKIKGKIDILLTGNHDDRMAVKHGHNYVEDMAKQLGVPWGWTGAYVRYIFKRKGSNWGGNTGPAVWTYDVYASHGFAVEMRKSGSRVNRILEMANVFPYADLYLMGHVHTLDINRRTPLRYTKKGKIEETIKYYVLTGGFLRGYVDGNPSYIERKMLEPQALGSPIIAIKPNTHEVNAGEVFQGVPVTP